MVLSLACIISLVDVTKNELVKYTAP